MSSRAIVAAFSILCAIQMAECIIIEDVANTKEEEIQNVRVRRNVKNIPYGLEEEEQDFIIGFHNDKRRTIYASDMNKLLFNKPLAEMANIVGEKCELRHWFPNVTDQPFVNGYIGQNIYAINSAQFNLTRAINAWWVEKSYYDYNSKKCTKKPCSHYTQMAWGDTYLVGCAYHFCDTIVTPSGNTARNYHFLVCNYGPAGNINGQRPYTQSSQPCTRCGNQKYWCDTEGSRGLCRSDVKGSVVPDDVVCSPDCLNGGAPRCDCTCQCKPQYKGGYCEDDGGCSDTTPKCGGVYRPWLCDNPNYSAQMRKKCPYTCNMCQGVEHPQQCSTLRMAPKDKTVRINIDKDVTPVTPQFPPTDIYPPDVIATFPALPLWATSLPPNTESSAFAIERSFLCLFFAECLLVIYVSLLA